MNPACSTFYYYFCFGSLIFAEMRPKVEKMILVSVLNEIILHA